MITLKLTQAEAIQSIKNRLTNAELDERNGLIILTGFNTNNRPVLCIWTPKSIKPVHHYYYMTEDRLISAACNFITNHQTRLKEISDKKAAEKTIKASDFYNVGDFIVCSWGYEQTNINFYMVTEVKNKTILVVEVCQQTLPGSEYGHGMACNVMPTREIYQNSVPFSLIVKSKGLLSKISSCQYPRKWDGQPEYKSWYY